MGRELQSPRPRAGRLTWAGLTLAGRRQLAGLPRHILDVVQANGPQGWLAAQTGFKHDLPRREDRLCGLRSPARGPEAS